MPEFRSELAAQNYGVVVPLDTAGAVQDGFRALLPEIFVGTAFTVIAIVLILLAIYVVSRF